MQFTSGWLVQLRPEGHGATRREYFRGMTFLCFCFDFKMNKINQDCVYDEKNVSDFPFFWGFFFLHQYQNKTQRAEVSMTVCLNILDLKSRQEFKKGELTTTLLWQHADLLHRKWKQDNRSNANDQTPFGSPFPHLDPPSDILHLAIRGRLSVPDISLLICMSYIHVILFVAKSWRGET